MIDKASEFEIRWRRLREPAQEACTEVSADVFGLVQLVKGPASQDVVYEGFMAVWNRCEFPPGDEILTAEQHREFMIALWGWAKDTVEALDPIGTPPPSVS